MAVSSNADQFGKRLTYLEGMRGLAAWMVVFNHTFNTFLPGWTRATVGFVDPHSWVQTIIFSPLNIPLCGHFAVLLFFVHSGFVLSYKYLLKDDDVNVLRSAASRRYVRLAGPAFISILLGYLLLKFGLIFTQQTAALTHSDWLGGQFDFEPHFLEAIKQGAFDVYFRNGSFSYNSSLWTIGTEFIGSYIVFSFLSLFGKRKKRPIFYAAAIGLFFKAYYLAFIFGILLCDLYISAHKKRIHVTSKITWLSSSFLLTLGLYLGAFQPGAETHEIYQPLAHFISIGLFEQIQTLGAAFVVAALLSNISFQRCLEFKFIQHLGKISYSVYLIHLSVLCSAGCGLYLFLSQTRGMPQNVSKAVSACTCFVLIYFLSDYFRRWIDEPSIKLAHRLSDTFKLS